MSYKTEVKKTTAIVCCTAKCKSNNLFQGNCCFPWKCCCALRFTFPKKRLQSSSISPASVRFFNLKHLKDKALTALCLASLRKRPPSASTPKASLPVKPKPPHAAVPISDSHTTEAVKACIEYINSTASSSVTLSSSASASSSASTCNLSGSYPNSVPFK